MAYEKDENGVLCGPPLHEWFGLSYSAYFVMPRLAMEAMPHDWQRRFIALMDEVEAAQLMTPNYHVLRDGVDYTLVKRYDEDDEGSRDYEFTAYRTDPWADYRRGSVKELCPEFKEATNV